MVPLEIFEEEDHLLLAGSFFGGLAVVSDYYEVGLDFFRLRLLYLGICKPEIEIRTVIGILQSRGV